MKNQSTHPLTIYTIGHSTHSIEEFVDILRAHNIERLIDIRTIPKSKHNPQFSKENLAKALRNKSINYRHMKDLGGLRHTTKDSPNTAWYNKSFRGYADYMLTDSFQNAANRLIELGKQKRTVIMCAEAVPWRCHRSLVGDWLTTKKIKVKDIMSKTSAKSHKLSKMAVVKKEKLIYPGD